MWFFYIMCSTNTLSLNTLYGTSSLGVIRDLSTDSFKEKEQGKKTEYTVFELGTSGSAEHCADAYPPRHRNNILYIVHLETHDSAKALLVISIAHKGV